MPKRSFLATLCLFFACLLVAGAQTPLPTQRPHQNFVDAVGNPCNGCLLYTYLAGTTTNTPTWTDATQATQNQNPIQLDASGGASIWVLNTVTYKFALYTSTNTLIWTADQVPGAPGNGVFLPLAGGTLTGPLVGSTATFTNASLNFLNTLDLQNYITVAKPTLAQGIFRLHASLPGSSQGPIHVVIFGDSQTICETPMSNCLTGPTVPTNRWAEQLRIQLQNAFGSHGTGVTPLINNVTYTTPNPQYYTSTGTLTQASIGLGPSQSSGFAAGTGVISMATGATVTFIHALPWDHLNIYCATTSGSGTLNYTVDGGGSTAATICNSTTSNATAHLYTSGSYSLTTHTVVATCATGPCYVYAMEGTAGTAGVSVDNLAVASAAAEWFGTSSSQLAFSDLIPNIELVLADLGTNDVNQNFGYSSTSYAAALTQIVTHERTLSTPAPSVLLIMPPVSSVATGANWTTYTAAALGVAQAQSTAYVNFQDRWGTTTSSAYYAQYFCADQVHPCDFGNLDEYSQISSAITDAQPTLPVTDGANSQVAATYVDRPGNAIASQTCNVPLTGYTATPAFCNAGDNFQAPSSNNYTEAVWGGTPNSSGLDNVMGLLDQTTNIFAWNLDASDDMCLGTPVSGGNVLTCTGANFIYHQGTGVENVKNLQTSQQYGNSQTVTFALQTAAGTTASLGGTSGCFTGITCTPQFGWLQFTPGGSGIATGDLVKVSWSTAWTHSAGCLFQTWDGSTNLAATNMIQDGASLSTTFFFVSAPGTAPTTGHAYIVIYHCE